MSKNRDKIELRKSQVLQAKLDNPTITEREIAKGIKEDKSTVHRDITALRQDGAIQADGTIQAIKETDLELVTLGQSGLLNWCNDVVKKGRIEREDARTLNDIIKTSQTRYSFLAGENAKEDGGEKSILETDKKTISERLKSLL